MPNDPLRDFAYITRIMSRTATDVSVGTGRNGPQRLTERVLWREAMKRVIGPAINNLRRR